MKKRPKWQWVLVGAAGLVVTAVLVTIMMFVTQLRPVNRGLKQPIAVSITKGQRTAEIAKQLTQMGIIRSPWAFQAYLVLSGQRGQIEAGYYELSAADSTPHNIKVITRGIVVNKAFLVPEGATMVQIQAQATQSWLKGPELDAAMTETYPNQFLLQRPAGATLEGYLFPDTYNIAPSTTARQLVQEMLNNFEQKVTPPVVAGLAAQGLTLHQGITLASIVERETHKASDRPLVAQVFLKRLRIGMRLDASPTAIYGANLAGNDTNDEDVAAAIASPYNTYRVVGLPPGPIGNPGLAAIDAVIHPANSDYLYFVADTDGNSYFAKTYAEHQSNVAKYLGR
jgi:UPF0755 protein